MSFHQSIHFCDHSQEPFLLPCSVPQLTELTKSSKVMKIQESHDTERYALNNTLLLGKYSILICSFQVSLETQILPIIVIAWMSSRATWSFETKMELAQIPSGCALGSPTTEADVKFPILLCECSGWTVAMKSVVSFTFGMMSLRAKCVPSDSMPQSDHEPKALCIVVQSLSPVDFLQSCGLQHARLICVSLLPEFIQIHVH